MNKKDYLIQSNGWTVYIMLAAAIGPLNEMEQNVSSAESARQECVTELFNIITRVASFSC